MGLLLLNAFNTSAQTIGQLWGVCQQGYNGSGTIFSTDSAGTNSISHAIFTTGGFAPLYVKLVQATNGKLYGMTSNGGNYGAGVLFEYDPVTHIFTQKYHFAGTDGANPYGSLIQASNGKLYGMTYSGGTNDLGVLFEYNISTGTMVKKLDFDGTNGANPYGALVQAPNGKLYGMTIWGNDNNYGVLFEFDTTSNLITHQVNFDDTIGAYPRGTLMLASNGKLYGVTSQGGVSDYGVLFEYDVSTNNLTKKIDFDTTTGSYPKGSLMQASNGNLYGMTYNGGATDQGALFEYNISSNILTRKVDFIDSTGTYPYGDLIQAGNGKLYGMTYDGGLNYYGALFEYDINSNTLLKKLDFDVSSGINPEGSLMKASNGKLYGLTNRGGNVDGGTLLEYDIATSAITNTVNLGYGPNGSLPVGPLLKAKGGKLYGLTTFGGDNGMGVLYEFDTSTNTLTKKANFNGTNGSHPGGALIQATDGKLYGLTSDGGSNNKGVLFVYDTSASTLTKKYDFDSTNGSNPNGALIQASNGKLYGMTKNGGSTDNGVLFEYTITSNTLIKKVDFDGSAYGAWPLGSLMQSSNGKLYGMTHNGGANDYGILFEYDIPSNKLTNKVDFDITNGANPLGSLMEANNGKLYGLTNMGGLNDAGVLFEYDTTSGILTKKVDFFGANGNYPDGSLIQAGNGKLYGLTYDGGDYGQGVLFEYDILGNVLTKKSDFLESYEGGFPSGSLIAISGIKPPVNVKAEICMVTMDSATGKNLVVWERNTSTSIKSFNIYKESWQAGIYTLIGNVPYNQLSVFVDSTSNPRKKSDIYCITSVNNSGKESSKSKTHKTIHLSANKGTSGEINLIWNPYEGYLYRSYKIYRGTSPANLTLLDSVSSNVSSYTDDAPPSGLVFYQVGSIKPDPCYPAIFRAQTSSGPYSQSVSNLKDYNTITGLYLTVSINHITLAVDEGSYNFINIYTNLPEWQATVDQGWLTLLKDSSKTNANVKIIAQKNTTGSMRVATVTITGTGVPDQTVVVIQETGSTGINTELPTGQLKLYPNPSKGLVNVDYELPLKADVQLSIYDMMGKLIKQTIHQNQLPGYYHMELNLAGQSDQNGIYYIRLSCGDKIFNNKLIIAK